MDWTREVRRRFHQVGGLLLAVGALACLLPAARAARVAPMALLRRG